MLIARAGLKKPFVRMVLCVAILMVAAAMLAFNTGVFGFKIPMGNYLSEPNYLR